MIERLDGVESYKVPEMLMEMLLERAVFGSTGRTDFPETKPDPVPEWEE